MKGGVDDEPARELPQHLRLEAGYVSDLPRLAAAERRYVAHIGSRGADPANVARRIRSSAPGVG